MKYFYMPFNDKDFFIKTSKNRMTDAAISAVSKNFKGVREAEKILKEHREFGGFSEKVEVYRTQEDEQLGTYSYRSNMFSGRVKIKDAVFVAVD